MTASLSSTLRCDDGTEVPFDWVYEGADAFEWIRDRAHWPGPMTPMELWVRHAGWPGADRAWAEAALQPPATFHRFQLAGPFQFVRMTPDAPERMAGMAPRYHDVAREHRNILGFWEQYAEPRIKQACASISAMGAGASLRTAAELWGYGFHQTFTTSALMSEAMGRLTLLLAETFGADSGLQALEVTQGGDNASQAIDGEIWTLAQLARQTPIVSTVFAASEQDETLPALRREQAATAFVAAFDALIERHGSRSQGWDLALETWRERPEAPLSLIRAQTAAKSVSPDAMSARSAELRAAAIDRALSALPASTHETFRQTVAEVKGYVGVREGRAYWQMTLTGAVRGLMLRVGEALVAGGRVDRADDALFLTPDDLSASATSDLRPLVHERRQAWERWKLLVTPLVIGTPGAIAELATAGQEAFRGAPASRGEVTGTARILSGPEDGARLKPGDILVCVMTTPAWTPLFGIAGGIITETGGALSHPAITAREYGIPAVVALQGATTRIREGQTVTLNGGTGVVSLEG